MERLRTRIEEVTSRQLEVARLVAEGRTNPEIASALGITLDGAKYHVSELLGRLGLERREEIAEWYRSERRSRRMRRFAGLFASAPRAFGAAAAATALVAIGVMLVVALNGGRAPDGPANVATSTPTATPAEVGEAGTTPVFGASGDASDLPDTLEGLPFLLGQRLRSRAPEVASWERVDWSDGCFEIDYPDGCPLSVSPVPGYRVVMHLDGEEYVARTDIEARRYRLEIAPPLPAFDAVYVWTGNPSDEYLCLDVQLAEGGDGMIASCGEAPTTFHLDQTGVGSLDVLAWLRSAATYEALPPDWHDPALQRMYVAGTVVEAPGRLPRAAYEWGQIVAIQAYTGHSGASNALAIAWQDPNSEGCTSIQVEAYGAIFLGGCPGGDGTVFLGNDELGQLYEWLDRYSSFEERSVDSSSGGMEETILLVAGRGGASPSEAEVDEIRDWLAALAVLGLTAAE